MPIVEYETKPWKATCDNCGEGAGGDGDGAYHLFDTRDEAESEARDYGWRLVGGVLTCESCLDDEKAEAKAAAQAVPRQPE